MNVWGGELLGGERLTIELVLGNFGAHFITIKILLKASISNNQIAQEACREGSNWGYSKENIGSMDGQDNFQNCGWKRC